MSQDLRFLLAERGVDDAIVAAFEATGVTSLSIFYLSADTKAEMRELLRNPPFGLAQDEENIAPAEKVRRTVAQARVLDAWVAAEARVKERTAVEATQRSGSLPLTLPAGEHVLIRRRYEDVHGRVEESAFPSDVVIDRRLQEVEMCSLVAEPLSEVTSRTESTDDPLSAVLDRDGSLRLRKGSSRVPLPVDSESLRRRLGVLAVSYVVARERNPTTAWLTSATHEAWREHVEYVLGEKVYGLRIPGMDTMTGPEWSTVLSYEHALRKEAVRKILYEGTGFREAMRAARTSTELRELSFVAPTMASILARGRRATASSSSAPPSKKARKDPNPPAGKGTKGAGKGKKATRGGKGKSTWHNTTTDGTPICYAYNSVTERCGGKCGRAHCCQVCLGPHPAHQHGTASSSAAAAE